MIDSFLTLSTSFFTLTKLLDLEEPENYEEHEANEFFIVLSTFIAGIVSAFVALMN